MSRKSTATAIGMSFLVPGSGSMYAGGVKGGAVILAVFLFFIALTVSGLVGVPLAAWFFVWVAGLVHSGVQVSLTNRSHRELY